MLDDGDTPAAFTCLHAHIKPRAGTRMIAS
jgi:hypothetical protein